MDKQKKKKNKKNKVHSKKKETSKGRYNRPLPLRKDHLLPVLLTSRPQSTSVQKKNPTGKDCRSHALV